MICSSISFNNDDDDDDDDDDEHSFLLSFPMFRSLLLLLCGVVGSNCCILDKWSEWCSNSEKSTSLHCISLLATSANNLPYVSNSSRLLDHDEDDIADIVDDDACFVTTVVSIVVGIPIST